MQGRQGLWPVQAHVLAASYLGQQVVVRVCVSRCDLPGTCSRSQHSTQDVKHDCPEHGRSFKGVKSAHSSRLLSVELQRLKAYWEFDSTCHCLWPVQHLQSAQLCC